ncbi:MAG: hypothetical protein LBM70_05710 [Victivallales bacterium]|jgi:hypothetical protein|nr:hypothetical protein [Victivallales bacterium]
MYIRIACLIVLLLIVPGLALTALGFAITGDKMRGFLLIATCFIASVLWLIASCGFIFIPQALESQWGDIVYVFYQLCGCIPFVIVSVMAQRQKNLWKLYSGVIGIVTTLLAMSGLYLFLYLSAGV